MALTAGKPGHGSEYASRVRSGPNLRSNVERIAGKAEQNMNDIVVRLRIQSGDAGFPKNDALNSCAEHAEAIRKSIADLERNLEALRLMPS